MSREVEASASQAGFTLAEVLVSICLVSLIMLLLFSGLQFGTAAWTRSGTEEKFSEQMLGTQQLIRRLLEQTYPAALRQETRIVGMSFKGESSQIEFTTMLPETLAAGGYQRVVIAFNRGEGRLAFAWRMERNREDDTPLISVPEAVTLASSVHQAEFAYFGQREDEKGLSWHDSWKNEKRLPRLVRLTITAGDKRKEAWPSLVVAPRIDVDATCVYDGLTQGCQGR